MSQAEPYLWLVVILALGYILLIRPQRNRAKAASQLQSALSGGDEVMLTSGVYGTVTGIDDEVLHVEVAPNVVLRVHRQSVARILVDHTDPSFGDGENDELAIPPDPFASPDPNAPDAPVDGDAADDGPRGVN